MSSGTSTAWSLLLASLLAGLVSNVSAQPTRPVYPAYEGFVENEDGSFTLVFGYYSHNAVEVTIPPGPANRFEPAPGDRGQPSRFMPGRQRNVCVMVVPGDFTGNLQWRIGAAGTVTATTEAGGLNPMYLLETIGSGYRAARSVDPKGVEPHVCVNRPPTVRAGQDRAVVRPGAVPLRGDVRDEGLPRTGTLEITWSRVSGPAPVTFEPPHDPSTTALFREPGIYRLRLTASDSELEASDEIEVTVEPAPTPSDGKDR